MTTELRTSWGSRMEELKEIGVKEVDFNCIPMGTELSTSVPVRFFDLIVFSTIRKSNALIEEEIF